MTLLDYPRSKLEERSDACTLVPAGRSTTAARRDKVLSQADKGLARHVQQKICRVLRCGRHPRGRHVRNSSSNDHFPVTIASVTLSSITDAIDFAAIITYSGGAQRPVRLCILSAQFEWLVDATASRHR
jgi:hypothetical protein